MSASIHPISELALELLVEGEGEDAFDAGPELESRLRAAFEALPPEEKADALDAIAHVAVALGTLGAPGLRERLRRAFEADAIAAFRPKLAESDAGWGRFRADRPSPRPVTPGKGAASGRSLFAVRLDAARR